MMMGLLTIEVEPDLVQIQPGGRASARVTLTNQGDAVEHYQLSVQGLEPAWYKVDPAEVGLFPGSKAALQVAIRPPADAVSATYQVTLTAQNMVNPADQVQKRLSLTVQRPGETLPPRPPDPARQAQVDAGSSAQPTVMRSSAPPPFQTQPQPVSASQGPATQPRPKEPQPTGPVQPPVGRPPVPPPVPAGSAAVVLRASSPTGQVLFTSDREGFKLPPGATSALNLGLTNAGGVGLNMELAVKGPPLSWVALSPSSLALAPGESGRASLSISIPAQAPLGSYPLAVVAQSAEDSSLLTRLNMMLEVTRPGDIALELSPAQAQGEISAEYTLVISQTGQTPLNVNLSARDDAGALIYSFTPAVINLPADGKATARLAVSSRQVVSGTNSLSFTFAVSAVPSGGSAAAASAQGRFTQLPPAPVKLLIEPDEIRDPGQAVFQLRMTNPGLTALAYRLSAADADNSCSFQFADRVLNLPPRGQAATQLTVTPLAYLTAGEMIHTLSVSAQPAGGRGSELHAEVHFIQTAGQPPTLNISPSSQTSAGPASFSIQVANPRPAPLQIELRAYDNGQLCQYVIDPASLNIPPMYQATARLDVIPVSDLLSGESRRICNFNVAGYPDGQPSPIIAEGTLLQIPGFTWRKLLPVFITAVVLLGLGGLAVLALLYMRFVH